MECLQALSLWDEVIAIYCPDFKPLEKPKQSYRYPPNLRLTEEEKCLLNVDYVPPTVPQPRGLARLLICEDNEAVIKSLMKVRFKTMGFLHKTHRIDLDFIIDCMTCLNIKMRYIHTKLQIADLMTKGSFTKLAFASLVELANLRPVKPSLAESYGL